MKRAFKNFILLLITISIFPNAVNGASIGSGPGDCSISNAYYDSNIFVNTGAVSNTRGTLIYDIVNVDLYNDVLYLYGWAFNSRVSTSLGSNAKVEFVLHPQDGKGEDVPFAVDYASPGNASCMGNGCGGNGGAPKYYDLTYWNCHRSSRGKPVNVNGTDVETGGYCMAGETNSPKLTGGFRAMIDLTLDKIEPDKTYVVKMKFTHSDPRSHISNSWIEVAAAKAVVFDRVFDYNGTDGKQISISGFKDTARVVASQARPTGKNGLYCSSSIASSSGLEAASSTHYAQTSGFPIKDERGSTQWACRGGSANCPNGATNGAGSIRLYELYYTKKGNQAVPASGAGGTSAYAPASWLQFDGNITISTTKEEDPEDPEIPAPVECEGGEIYKFYYFFLAGVSDGWFGKSDTKRMITSADANNFDDKEILQMLGFTSNSEIKKAGGIYPINKDNLSWYYEKLKSAQSGANRWSADGDGKTFYITYNSWCTAGTNGETKCYDANTGCELDKNGNKTNICNPNEIASSSFDTNEYIKATINVAVSNDKKDSLIITPQDAKAGLGYQFGISRFFKKYPNGYPSLANPGTKATPTKSNKHYLHPAVYQLTFCKTEEPQCDDTVNAAECPGGDTGVEFVFNEHDDKTACTLKHGTHSGFTIVEEDETKGYCSVACKENLHGYVPGSKETAAGQYFLFDNYIPKIEAERTCVTSNVDYNKFDNNLKALEAVMPKKYNDYQDYFDHYLHLTGSGSNNLPDSSSNMVYGKYTQQCVVPCEGENCPEEPEIDSYIVEQWQFAGQSQPNKYISGSEKCGVEKEGTPFSESSDSGKKDIDQYQKDFKETGSSEIGEYERTIEECNYTPEGSTVTITYHYTVEDWTIYYHAALNDSHNDFHKKSGTWIQTTPCSGNDGMTYAQALRYHQNEMRNTAATHWNSYIDDFLEYQDHINSYNACFNWMDLTDDVRHRGAQFLVKGGEPRQVKIMGGAEYAYKYGFKPYVAFDYEDPDGAAFPVQHEYDYDDPEEVITSNYSGGETCPDTTAQYWPMGTSSIDSKYENGGTSQGKSCSAQKGLNYQLRPILDCNGTKCVTYKNDVGFYTSAYVRRDEKITYEYHLPKLYTTVPDGITFSKNTPDRDNGKTHLELDPEAVPVNINTLTGTYDYHLTIDEITDDLRKEKQPKNTDDDFEDRFEQKALNAGDDYVCTYDVINDIYLPGPERFNFFYRVVDPFEINPLGRTLGYNWTDGRGDEVQNWMREDASDYQTLTNSSTRDKFEFTFTPLAMQEIRKYNAMQTVADDGYADWDLTCNDYGYGNGYHCRSNFLSCAASGGTQGESGHMNCSEIFENSLTNYSKLSKYGWSELEANRRLIINKQNDIDCRNGNIQEACG